MLERCGSPLPGAKTVSVVFDDLSAYARLAEMLQPTGHFLFLMTADCHCQLPSDTSVIIVDLDLRSRDGVSVIRALHDAFGGTPILAVIESPVERQILAALQAGANGCLLHADLGRHLVPAIEDSLAGGVPFSPAVGRLLLEHFRGCASRAEPEATAGCPELSKREREILNELAGGLTYDQIAAAQGVSVNTVRGFVRALYGKLQVGSRTEAVVRASKLGWIRGEPSPTGQKRHSRS